MIHGESAIGPALASGAVVAAASYLIGAKRGDIRVDIALASIASFLFGILMAFTIVRTRERLALVQDLVSKGNASLLSIHSLMAVFAETDRSVVRELIDHQLTDQIDYRLVDNFPLPRTLPSPMPSSPSNRAPVRRRSSTRRRSRSASTWDRTGH